MSLPFPAATCCRSFVGIRVEQVMDKQVKRVLVEIQVDGKQESEA